MAIEIQVQNQSTVLRDAALLPILTAVEAQIAEDVAPFWANEPVKLTLVARNQPLNPHRWQFIVTNDSNVAGAAGYHETTAGGEPIGYAFVETTIRAGMHPSVTISHELLEMIGDALIDQANQWSDLPNALFLAQELCDPVEEDALGYDKRGVLVSDFVTPEYFVPGSAGPWDFRGHLNGPWNPAAMTPGAYQLTWDPNNGWQQVFPQNRATGRAALHTPHSRRARRMKARQEWRQSEH